MESKLESLALMVAAAAGMGATGVEGMRRLRRWLDLEADPKGAVAAIQREAQSHRGASYLWMLVAQARLELGEPLVALQCWYLAMRARPDVADESMLAALGVMDAAGWLQLGRSLQVHRVEYLRGAFDSLRREHSPRDLFRIERALAGYLGEVTVVSQFPTQRPKLMFIPGLGGHGFLDAGCHPLVAPLLARSEVIGAELKDALEQQVCIEPFMGKMGGQDMAKYVTGSVNASWDALFFYRHGVRYDDNHQRFPDTSAALEELDLCRISAQAPEVCFSILRPFTRIEPHHGVTNARVVIHIPLLVPSGCYLELSQIGRHYWQRGEALVFDDTFEHSAENPTDQLRGILLLDAWHPDLTAVERQAFCKIIEAITAIEAAPLA
jgi:hypothetical protein